MQNFQDILETRQRSFISAFSICMTVPLKESLVFRARLVVRSFSLRLKIITVCSELNIFQINLTDNVNEQFYILFLEILQVNTIIGIHHRKFEEIVSG